MDAAARCSSASCGGVLRPRLSSSTPRPLPHPAPARRRASGRVRAPAEGFPEACSHLPLVRHVQSPHAPASRRWTQPHRQVSLFASALSNVCEVFGCLAAASILRAAGCRGPRPYATCVVVVTSSVQGMRRWPRHLSSCDGLHALPSLALNTVLAHSPGPLRGPGSRAGVGMWSFVVGRAPRNSRPLRLA
jgi:hypothetical protein